MILAGKLAVGFFNFYEAGLAVDAQDAIVIFLHRLLSYAGDGRK